MKNKFLCVFFAVTALLLCFVFSANASLGLTNDEILELEEVENYDECYSSGDADNSGTVESDDARFILRVSVNLDKIDASFFMKADVDGDGNITASDARAALRLAVGLDDAPAHAIEEVVVIPATCSTDGLTVKVCTTCLKIYAKVTLPATTDKHITGFWETVKEPDCSHKGLAQLKCLACGILVEEAELSATGRHSGEWIYPDGKDCFNPVAKTRTCTVCGVVENKTENPQGGHTFKWTDKVEKTCTEDGVQVNMCTNCGFVKEEAPLPATGHIFEYDSVIKEATCEETGLIAKKCVKCEYTENERATPALGHKYDNNRYKVTKEPTCAEEGSADVICSTCGDAKALVLDKLAHTLTDKWTETTAPTCTQEGEKTGTCRYCGSVTEKIPAKGHDAAKWTVAEPATCTKPGVMQGECKVCGDVAATKEIEIIPHTFDESTVYWTSGIRCKENANGYYKCKDCDAKKDVILLQVDGCTSKNFKKTEVVIEATCTEKPTVIDLCDYCKQPIEGTEKVEGDALGHDYTGNEMKIVTPATCTEDGLGEYTCSRCGEKKTEVIKALGHDFSGEWVITTPATCTTAGTNECKCTRCDEKITDVIKALGHDFAGEWETTKPATCTEAGLKELGCTRCDETIKDSIEALGHDFAGEWETTKPASCTEAGLKELGCTRCDETQKETINATGHTPGEWTAAGNGACEEVLLCVICGEELDTRAIGHNPVKMIIADSAALDENGNFVVQCRIACSVCGETIGEADPIIRIAVNCNDESLEVVFDEYTEVTSGSEVYFMIDGEYDSLFVMVDYGLYGSEILEAEDGIFFFTIPEDLAETETITIVVAKLA